MLASLASLFAVPSVPSRADACGNSYTQYYVLSGAREALEGAERALSRGAASVAMSAANRVANVAGRATPVRSITSAMRAVSENENGSAPWEARVSDDAYEGPTPQAASAADGVALAARARMLRGISIARMDGQLNSVLTPIRRATASQREARFQFALADLAAAVAADPTAPRAQAYQAEAQARRDPSGVDAARTTLRQLAQRDVLPDAWSWAMLARLETDPAARAQALVRCNALAGRNAARACVP